MDNGQLAGGGGALTCRSSTGICWRVRDRNGHGSIWRTAAEIMSADQRIALEHKTAYLSELEATRASLAPVGGAHHAHGVSIHPVRSAKRNGSTASCDSTARATAWRRKSSKAA